MAEIEFGVQKDHVFGSEQQLGMGGVSIYLFLLVWLLCILFWYLYRHYKNIFNPFIVLVKQFRSIRFRGGYL